MRFIRIGLFLKEEITRVPDELVRSCGSALHMRRGKRGRAYARRRCLKL